MNMHAGDDRPLILGLGGTIRSGSSSEKALRVSLRAAEAAGARTAILAGPDLDVPMYAPENPARTEQAQRMVALFRQCEGIIVASPSYHGSISGLIKNALDYTEDLHHDPRCYFDGIAMGVIACGGGWQGAGQTLAALRNIGHALRAWTTPFGAVLNTSTPQFDAAGDPLESTVRNQLEIVGRQVLEFAQMRRALTRAG